MGYNCYNNSRYREQNSCGAPDSPDSCLMGKSLAMAYVPWQKWKDIYDFDKGLCTGTIFHELNKPFEGGRRYECK